jgi:hypothetical protein
MANLLRRCGARENPYTHERDPFDDEMKQVMDHLKDQFE